MTRNPIALLEATDAPKFCSCAKFWSSTQLKDDVFSDMALGYEALVKDENSNFEDIQKYTNLSDENFHFLESLMYGVISKCGKETYQDSKRKID